MAPTTSASPTTSNRRRVLLRASSIMTGHLDMQDGEPIIQCCSSQHDDDHDNDDLLGVVKKPLSRSRSSTASTVRSSFDSYSSLSDDDDDENDNEDCNDEGVSPPSIEEPAMGSHPDDRATPYERNLCRRIVDALTDDERASLADADMPLRHLRAEKGDVDGAIRKIKDTLSWRKDFGVEQIKRCFNPHNNSNDAAELRSVLSFENSTGKIYARGYDKSGRAVLYLVPGMENSSHELNAMKHLTYQLERACAASYRKSAKRTINIVISYKGFHLRNAPTISTTKHTLRILQHHYPERMHRAYICDPPLVFRTFWSMVKPFVDPVTRSKIVFCHGKEGLKALQRDFDLETTEKCAGGTRELRPFDSTEYLTGPFDMTFDDAYGVC